MEFLGLNYMLWTQGFWKVLFSGVIRLPPDTIPGSRDQKAPVIYPKCIWAATVQNSLLFNEIAFLQETAPAVILLACIFSTSDDAHLIEANISYKCLASQNKFEQNLNFQKLQSFDIVLNFCIGPPNFCSYLDPFSKLSWNDASGVCDKSSSMDVLSKRYHTINHVHHLQNIERLCGIED